MSERLPDSWVRAELGQVTSKPQYGWTTKAVSEGDNLKLLRTTDISTGRVNWETVPTCYEEPKEPAKYFLNKDDIVVSRAGSVGKSFLIREDVTSAVFASYLIRLKPFISSEYISYFMQGLAYWDQISEKSSGIATPNVNATKLASIELPVAPLAEQTRIADKIDGLFSQLNAGEEALRTAELLLERYRQSVLKAAVTGELTRAWREKNRDKLESGEELLERILKARRENWEGRGKYKEPAPPDTTDLPELPEGWVWASLGQLFTLHNGDRGKNYPSRKDYVPNGIPIINAGHLENGKIDLARLNYIKEEHYSRLRAGKIQPNDILVCIRGSLGKFALSNLSEGAIASSLVILRSSVVTTIEYVMLYLASPLLKDEIFKYDNGTAQPNLSAENLGRFAIPLPPIHEMYALIEMMSGFSANVESLVDVLNKTSLRSSSLRQSILREAFSGRLVPQDPADEPAWVLLERIGKGKG